MINPNQTKRFDFGLVNFIDLVDLMNTASPFDLVPNSSLLVILIDENQAYTQTNYKPLHLFS